MLKNKKWSEIGLQENYQEILGPFGAGSKDNAHCYLCGVEQSERKIIYNSNDEKYYCTFCESFTDMTNELKDADCLVV